MIIATMNWNGNKDMEKDSKTKISVLHLRSSGGFYGAERVILNLSKEIQRTADIDVTLGVIESGMVQSKGLAQKAKEAGIDTIIFPCRWQIDLETVKRIRKYIQDHKIMILHTHDYKSTILGWFATLSIRVKRVATVHGYMPNNFKLWIYELLDRLVLKIFFDCIVLVADEQKRVFKNSKINVIPNGVDVANFEKRAFGDSGGDISAKHSFYEKFGLRSNDFVVGVIGRLSPEKGHVYVIEAAKDLIKKHANIKFMFVGDGPLEKFLKVRIGEEKMNSHFIFTGFIDNIKEIYQILDLLLIPSVAEGAPLALLEAMSASVPVVASDVGDIQKAVIHGKTGWLIKPKDVQALIHAISLLNVDSKKCEVLARNAFEKIKNEFSIDAMAKQYISIYHELSEEVCCGA